MQYSKIENGQNRESQEHKFISLPFAFTFYVYIIARKEKPVDGGKNDIIIVPLRQRLNSSNLTTFYTCFYQRIIIFMYV